MRLAVSLVAVLLAFPTGSVAAVCQAGSGDVVRPLVELYTSEGCNSCPPADRWLSRTFEPGREHVAVPLAFHVDYWDRLGWKDRFARADYTARQYRAMRANRATFVYTPQILLQGRDERRWRSDAFEQAIAKASAGAPRAVIAATAVPADDATEVELSVALTDAPKTSTEVGVAYVDSGLSSDVGAGENRGEQLLHDHVVRDLKTRTVAHRTETFRFRLARPREAGRRPMIVAFVQHVASGDVLQTLSLSLAGCLR